MTESSHDAEDDFDPYQKSHTVNSFNISDLRKTPFSSSPVT